MPVAQRNVYGAKAAPRVHYAPSNVEFIAGPLSRAALLVDCVALDWRGSVACIALALIKA